MSTLISVDYVVRQDTGFDHVLTISDTDKIIEQELLVIEPMFKEFANANNDQLGAVFKVAKAIESQAIQPYTVVVNISYSKGNAKVIKGYLQSVVQHFKASGWKNFTSMHVPFEAYGCPMVGSVLSLIFCKEKMAYTPTIRSVLPSEYFPGLMYHAVSGRMKGSIYPGTAGVSGFFNSNSSFLPDFSTWDTSGLRTEYQEGATTVSRAFRNEDIQKLFGAKEWMHQIDLHLCTPPSVLSTFLKNIKLLGDGTTQPK